MASGVRMLAGGRDGGTLERLRDDAGTEGGDGGGGDSLSVSLPPVSASTLRTSAGTSTGRTNRPLPSWARACSGLAIEPPGRATKSTSMASAFGSSRMRATTSSAPSPSASTRMTRGCCTATRAMSIDSGTSTTTYPAVRRAWAMRSASAVGSLTNTVVRVPRATALLAPGRVGQASPSTLCAERSPGRALAPALGDARQPACPPGEHEDEDHHRELAARQRQHSPTCITDCPAAGPMGRTRRAAPAVSREAVPRGSHGLASRANEEGRLERFQWQRAPARRALDCRITMGPLADVRLAVDAARRDRDERPADRGGDGGMVPRPALRGGPAQRRRAQDLPGRRR